MVFIRFWIFISLLPYSVFSYKDVVFLVDKSSSLSQEDFSDAIDFIYNITKFINIGSSATQFSVVTFSSDITEQFDLNDYTSKASLLTAITALKSITPSGSTYTYDALTFARTSSFISAKGSRNGIGKAVVVVTDGQSVNMVKTATEAQLLKNDLNAEVFSIGIGSAVSASNPELLSVSSDPDSYYSHHVTSYLSLCSLVPTMVPKLDSSSTANTIAGCPVTASPVTSTDDNTVVIASVATASVVSGIGLTALIASLLEKKLRGRGKVDSASPYNNNARRGTNRAIFDSSALNDPAAREVPPPDDIGQTATA